MTLKQRTQLKEILEKVDSEQASNIWQRDPGVWLAGCHGVSNRRNPDQQRQPACRVKQIELQSTVMLDDHVVQDQGQQDQNAIDETQNMAQDQTSLTQKGQNQKPGPQGCLFALNQSRIHVHRNGKM